MSHLSKYAKSHSFHVCLHGSMLGASRNLNRCSLSLFVGSLVLLKLQSGMTALPCAVTG